MKTIKEIANLGRDELSDYDLKKSFYLKEELGHKVDADKFIYAYEQHTYDGSGIAVWNRGDKWYYHYLGHCSCYGPTEGIWQADNASFTKDEIIKILEAEYNYNEELYKPVREYLENIK